jgi:DNA-binding NarL/FixJ family response regulator
MQKKKILLVDDEPGYIEALVSSLESRGFECVIATEMEAGIKALEDPSWSAVVTDVMMPAGKSFPSVDSSEAGFYFIEYAQRHQPRLPIVCLSVIADQAKIQLLTRRGVRYLRKGETPLSTAVEVVTAVAEGRRVRVKPQ